MGSKDKKKFKSSSSVLEAAALFASVLTSNACSSLVSMGSILLLFLKSPWRFVSNCRLRTDDVKSEGVSTVLDVPGCSKCSAWVPSLNKEGSKELHVSFTSTIGFKKDSCFVYIYVDFL